MMPVLHELDQQEPDRVALRLSGENPVVAARPAPPEPAIGHLADLSTLDLGAGADNLLFGCMSARPGDRLLLVREDSRHGFYDCMAPAFVADRARIQRLDVIEVEADPPDVDRDLPADIVRLLQDVDHALFFARIGDQLRFDIMPGQCTKTISYAFDAACLGSGYGTMPYAMMLELKAHIDARLAGAGEIRITCPLGTELVGVPHGMTANPSEGEVTIRRFPLNVFKPVPAIGFSGRVALARWLVGTGSRCYQPYELRLDGIAFALLEHGRIVDFEGPKDVVAKIRQHHQTVGELFSIDPLAVHSWHAGIHPHTVYPLPATHNLARWAGLAFGSPRFLHFHVCGDTPPGEISWTVIDPSITIDGARAWDRGRLALIDSQAAGAIIARYGLSRSTFDRPSAEIGV
ncbi:MAG: hypothetical protein OEU92_07810 [Alphaproteobacteria bacterium]|nr:hypothetical protein [Alphaproteobacteria bacterium]